MKNTEAKKSRATVPLKGDNLVKKINLKTFKWILDQRKTRWIWLPSLKQTANPPELTESMRSEMTVSIEYLTEIDLHVIIFK
jgi:hypothetical protein